MCAGYLGSARLRRQPERRICRRGDRAGAQGIINQAGVSFSGHTEFFAQQSDTADVVMLLATEGLRGPRDHPYSCPMWPRPSPRIALASAIRILDAISSANSASSSPGSMFRPNPHAGEGGHLGREEIDVIEPRPGRPAPGRIDLVGPLPADTLFQDKYLSGCGCGTRHVPRSGAARAQAQGLWQPGSTSPSTSIRTSVDHGTALILAGKEPGRPRQPAPTAINHAIQMVEKKEQAGHGPHGP